MRRLIVVLWCAAVAACGSSARDRDDDFTARPEARRFEIVGRVVSVQPNEREVTLAHDRIDGFMDAMTMPLKVKERWAFDVMKPGDRLRGTLVVDGSRSWLEGVSVTRGDRNSAPATAAAKGTWAPADPGTPVPTVSLIDHKGRPLRWDRLLGEPLLLTFSYTRCPLPEYCPLIMQRSATLFRQTAEDPSLKAVRLLTVTLDPQHDTPEILRSYGKQYGADVAAKLPRWTLATGDPAAVKKLAGFLGLDYYTEGQVIIHSLRMAVIGPDGRLVKVFEFNRWNTEDVLRELKSLKAGT